MINSIKWIIVLACISLSTIGCGLKYNVKGQVIDAQTKEPIEGAVAIIHWWDYDYFPGVFFGSRDHDPIGTYEYISDKDGQFHLPAFLNRHYTFAVYKRGYVCFVNYTEFLKGKEGRMAARLFNPKNGMVIPLEPLTEEYNKRKHAFFVRSIKGEVDANEDSAYGKATRPERLSYYDR